MKSNKLAALLSSLLVASLATTLSAQVQTYKIGDIHPNGGIVFTVDESGTQGTVVEEKDSGPFTPPEAIDAAKQKGWGMPYIGELRKVYENLHKQGKGGFQPALYQVVDASSAQYRKGIHFNDGKEETGIAQNNKTLVRFVRKFKPDLKELVVASGGTWEGDWSWVHDDSHGKSHSKITVQSETDFIYVYMDQKHNLKGKLGHADGNINNPVVVDLDLPDGNHLRFEWKSMKEVEAKFWQKGQKDKAPETTSKMVGIGA